MTTGPKSTPPVRQRDPTARRMLAGVLALEGSHWPETRPAYAAALLALATRCEQVEARAEMYRWGLAEFRGYLLDRSDRVSECRVDALADMATGIAGMLLRLRSGLNDDRRPNLASMLRKALIWIAKDIYRSRYERHASRTAPELRDNERPAVGRTDSRTLANEVLALLADEPGATRTSKSLRMVGLGYSIAEAARRTGASRQQIYRARDELLSRIEDAGDE